MQKITRTIAILVLALVPIVVNAESLVSPPTAPLATTVSYTDVTPSGYGISLTFKNQITSADTPISYIVLSATLSYTMNDIPYNEVEEWPKVQVDTTGTATISGIKQEIKLAPGETPSLAPGSTGYTLTLNPQSDGSTLAEISAPSLPLSSSETVSLVVTKEPTTLPVPAPTEYVPPVDTSPKPGLPPSPSYYGTSVSTLVSAYKLDSSIAVNAIQPSASADELALLNQFNYDRLAHNSPALSYDPVLSSTARYLLLDEIKNKYLGPIIHQVDGTTVVPIGTAAQEFGFVGSRVTLDQYSDAGNPLMASMYPDWAKIYSVWGTQPLTKAFVINTKDTSVGVAVVPAGLANNGEPVYKWAIILGTKQ